MDTKALLRQGGFQPSCLNNAFVRSFEPIWESYVPQWAHFFLFWATPYLGTTWALYTGISYALRYWLADLYRRPDLVPYMRNDMDPNSSPTGSLHRSEGYRDKVFLNDHINGDPHGRHAPLILCADGTPLFKDKNALSAIFGILSHAGMPESLAKEPGLTHLTVIIPSYEWEVDDNGVFKKVKKYAHFISISCP